MSPGATHRTAKHPDSLRESGGRYKKKKSESRLRKAQAGLGLCGDLCAAPKLCVCSRVGKTRCWAQVPHIWGGSLSGVPRYMQSWQDTQGVLLPDTRAVTLGSFPARGDGGRCVLTAVGGRAPGPLRSSPHLARTPGRSSKPSHHLPLAKLASQSPDPAGTAWGSTELVES